MKVWKILLLTHAATWMCLAVLALFFEFVLQLSFGLILVVWMLAIAPVFILGGDRLGQSVFGAYLISVVILLGIFIAISVQRWKEGKYGMGLIFLHLSVLGTGVLVSYGMGLINFEQPRLVL